MGEQGVKVEVVGRLGEERQRVLKVLSGLSDAQWAEPGVSGPWSAKDILAHLVAREQDALQGLQLARRGISQAREYQDLDAFNARVVADNQSRAVQDLLEVWDDSFKKLLSAVSQLKEEDFSPDSPVSRALGEPVAAVLERSTYGHYAEHRRQIETWLAGRTSSHR